MATYMNQSRERAENGLPPEGDEEPATLDDEGPVSIPRFITTTNAYQLYGLRPGETVLEAMARKAKEG